MRMDLARGRAGLEYADRFFCDRNFALLFREIPVEFTPNEKEKLNSLNFLDFGISALTWS